MAEAEQTQDTTDPAVEETTLLEGTANTGTEITDWRSIMAGEDTAQMEKLGRYKTAADYNKAFDEGQKTIRSGAHKAAPSLPDTPTDEQLAAYRTEVGVPLEAKGYLDALPEGMVLGEADTPAAASFAEHMHGSNASPEFVGQALTWYQKQQEVAEQAQQDGDAAFRNESGEVLRSEWGGDFKANLDAGKNYVIATAPTLEDGTKVSDLIMAGRTADGKMLGDHPGFLKWLAHIAHEQNPAGFVAPGTGLSQEQSVANEIADIEKLMSTSPTEYYKDEAKQSRLRKLYEAREKFSTAA